MQRWFSILQMAKDTNYNDLPIHIPKRKQIYEALSRENR